MTNIDGQWLEEKINTRVNFENNLNLRNIILNPPQNYNLISCIYHLGRDINAGHYINIGRNFIDNKIYIYNDQNIVEVRDFKYKNLTPYILM